MSPTDPPELFDPLAETIPAGTIVFRVHEPALPNGASNDGTLMNPGLCKPTRFGFFGDPPVPVVYASDTPEGAVHETVLHDAQPHSFIPTTQWRTKVLTVLEVTQPLRVAAFHSDGLRGLGLYARDLTDTDPINYPTTVKWAKRAWQTGFDGVSYMCRHYNASKAYCLFHTGTHHPALHALDQHPQTRTFTAPRDRDWLTQLALDINVTLHP